VHQMVLTLEGKGLIARTPGTARSIRRMIAPEDSDRHHSLWTLSGSANYSIVAPSWGHRMIRISDDEMAPSMH
jgi:hypothetical protein